VAKFLSRGFIGSTETVMNTFLKGICKKILSITAHFFLPRVFVHLFIGILKMNVAYTLSLPDGHMITASSRDVLYQCSVLIHSS
jgi:hypothetical protein